MNRAVMSADGVWEVFDDKLLLLGATYGRGQARMVAMGLRDGGLVVWSPGSRSDEARAGLEKWGKPRFLLAPNHFHNAGLVEWMRAYPEARIVAHPNAHARLHKKVNRAHEIAALDVLEGALPEGVRLFGPSHAKQGETWIGVERDSLRALVVCDAVVNFASIGWQFKLLGFRERLMTNPFFKRLFLTDKAAYKEWMLDELQRRPPTLFVPGHGNVLRGDDLAERLREATRLA